MLDKMENSLGKFTVGGKMVVTDPCYNLENGKVLNVVPGEWEAFTHYNDEGRVTHLLARHSDYHTYRALNESNFSYISDEMGVDSGQMAFCDLKHYSTDDEEYQKYCDQTSSDESGGIVGDYAAVSATGWGDGEYTLYGAYLSSHDLKNPTYYALYVEFIPDEDEEDEYEDIWDDDD